jgi:hypothetical protein
MKTFLKFFFIILGVIFFIIIIIGVYLYVADPFEIKPLIKSLTEQPTTVDTKKDTNKTTTVTDKNSHLSPAQEQVLEKIGVDPATIPTSITPAMEDCFYTQLGSKRADEIKNGAEPTASDYF